MLSQRDDAHHTVYKKRRCFLWQQIYFQLDIYQMSGNSRCQDILMLETYSTLPSEKLYDKLPPFLTIVREVTNEKEYSMHHLSLKESREPTANGGSGSGGSGTLPTSAPITINGNGINHHGKGCCFSRAASLANGVAHINGYCVDPINDNTVD